MKFRARGARIAFVLAFTILCSNPLTAQDSPIRGRFQVIWEDPEMHQEAGRMRFFVTDELNRANEILIPRSLASNIVDVLDLDGQYVRVEGRRVHDADAMTGMSVEADVLDPVPAPTGQLSVEGLSSIMTGERPWVTLLCRFAGSNSTPHARSWYEAIMGSSYPGMIDYWRESSFGQLDLVRGDVVGWYDLPQPRSAYMNGDVPDVNRLKGDCATAADDDVDFPAYFGVNFQFNESLGCCSFGGRGQLILDGQTKAYSMTWLPNWSDQRLYAHEMGHGFGLRHSSGPYGNTYDSNWDVMSRGRNHSDPNYGWVAPHTISYHKDGLGWFDAAKTFVASPGSSERIRLHRIGDPAASGEYHIAKIPLTSETFYTVEVRRSYGYDQNLPGDAVVLHHVDLSRGAYVVDPDNDGDPNDAGAMWLPGETFTDNAAGVTVRVESSIADGYEVTVPYL